MRPSLELEPRSTKKAWTPPPAERFAPTDSPRAIPVHREGVEPATSHSRTRVRDTDGFTRALNVAIAGTALLVLLPVMVVVGLAVKLTSPGPMFYRQTRVGVNRRARRADAAPALYDRRTRNLGGSVFTIYKFRSMRADAEKGTGAVWATVGDARVTPVGRFIRKTRLDELPQLINVLMGDMNIVGPRPERPSLFLQLSEKIENYDARTVAKPGITGWAQINQQYDTCLDDVREKVRYDLEYIQRQSVLVDLGIMLKTVPVMLSRRGGW